MARIALNCSCGWNFFIPGTTTGHEVTCPSCAQSVRIPGRKPGRDVPMTPGAIAARKQARQKLYRLLAGGVVAAAVAGAVALWPSSPPAPLPDPEPPRVTRPRLPERPIASNPETAKTDPDPIRNTAAPAFDPGPVRRSIDEALWQGNMAALISEVMRFHGLTNEWGQFQAEVARFDRRIKQDLENLARHGEKVALNPYLMPGDRILSFDSKDLSAMNPREAAQVLHRWFADWQAGAQVTRIDVLREDQKLAVFLMFPEATKELTALVQTPGVIEPGTLTVGIPTDLVKDVQSKFESLPRGYHSYLAPAEQKRLEVLSKNRRGTTDDVDWLRKRVLEEALPSFQREAADVRAKILEIEPKILPPLAVDLVHRKNGTKMEGQVLEVTDKHAKVKFRLGTVTIPIDDIEKIEKGKGSGAAFPAKLAEAKGNVDKLVQLLAWCGEKGLRLEKEYVAYLVLTLDASNEKARAAVGLPRPALPDQK